MLKIAYVTHYCTQIINNRRWRKFDTQFIN